jgi:membrane-bound lytic murein transglycosylase A
MIQSPSPISRPRTMRRFDRRIIAFIAAALAACTATSPPTPPATSTALTCPAPAACPVCPVCPAPPPEAAKVPTLVPVTFADIAGWQTDRVAETWPALLAGCTTLRNRDAWRAVCERAIAMSARAAPSERDARAFFESQFVPYRVRNADGVDTGLITGYYEPLLRGSRTRGGRYVTPLYAAPDDLIVVDLGDVAPETKTMRLRGRLEGRRLVPYYSREEIEKGVIGTAGKELVWVDDPIEAFFLQVQGSGRVRLPDGQMMRVGYADQNGHPYRSIGRHLVEIGELKVEQASLQGIQAWARANPARLDTLLNVNPSYVFFREMPRADGGPLGALGVPLTAERSMAIDPRAIPLGAPVFLATTRPNSNTPLARLMMAQDTGGAIRGNVRADYFWGFGADAGREAGRMRQQGRMWVLLPRDWKVEVN